MHPHEQEYFNVLLQLAVDRFSERIVQRTAGAKNALERLRSDPQGDGVWLDAFVEAFFRDALLDQPAGWTFIVQALSARRLDAPAVLTLVPEAKTYGELVSRLAVRAFADLLRQKTEEALEQALAFGGEE
ncbi:hypothetical protein AB1399_05185 [Hydrogenibacillus schlegelii]|uniref:Uncharacterized protein n=1 Tax=Hydrogenibacillus schlegelii TaxID=1484 RepID=A0A132N859_HYDSH|nr:hypothetical protein [Hydrogenibacillus schlegelii]KWX06293.1 hypothetical protein TR75_06405 [Hydrogenibacillus schlegelii]MBT9281813.1 hypothetical protein [Hydrogenibacillus schlegelii]OAR03351.1 hypothetical protein SA87_04165 [Hydrogenibacillus schlegelii]PTQ53835.1 MAG: hypothetical protein HSCHL_1209 [Hydrogenibacillus schlegelii]